MPGLLSPHCPAETWFLKSIFWDDFMWTVIFKFPSQIGLKRTPSKVEYSGEVWVGVEGSVCVCCCACSWSSRGSCCFWKSSIAKFNSGRGFESDSGLDSDNGASGLGILNNSKAPPLGLGGLGRFGVGCVCSLSLIVISEISFSGLEGSYKGIYAIFTVETFSFLDFISF